MIQRKIYVKFCRYNR